mmetsp:Transcript_27183/g.49615  ORF Transcript_27183/g.49615 Transcript_27183/m.49615 type:complete len:295 (-) Transcript_27183:156-1040(-)
MCLDRIRSFAVDIGKAFQIPLGMPRRHPAHPGGGIARTGPIAGDQPFGFAKRRVPQIVWILLRPFQPAGLAIDPNAQRVFIARRHLRTPQHPLGSAVKAQHYMPVVVHRTARHKGIQIGGKAFDLKPGDEPGEVMGMGANVTGGPSGPRPRRISTPFGLFERLVLGQPVLRIFHLNNPDFADSTACNHLSGLPHHRIPRVIVGQHKQSIGAFRRLHQLLRIRQGRGQRLVTNHVNAPLQKLAGRFIMHMIGRDDGNGLDPVLEARLTDRHRLEVIINARQPQRLARRAGLLGRR